MSMTDNIADTLTRIRNANTVRHPFVDIPASKLKEQLIHAVIRQGYLTRVERIEMEPVDILRVTLKYTGRNERVISGLRRISRPGRRVYVGAKDLPVVMDGLGVAILSTPKGVLSDSECREQNVGGEVLCHVW